MDKRDSKHPHTIVVDAPRQASLADLFRAWREEDANEQRDTLEYLMQVLDQDRLSNRKLFE